MCVVAAGARLVKAMVVALLAVPSTLAISGAGSAEGGDGPFIVCRGYDGGILDKAIVTDTYEHGGNFGMEGREASLWVMDRDFCARFCCAGHVAQNGK